MHGVLQAYIAKLDDVRQFIESAEQAGGLAEAASGAGLTDRHGKSLDPVALALIQGEKSRRQFVYSAVVVSLYGAFDATPRNS